jgi:hypothetical protein
MKSIAIAESEIYKGAVFSEGRLEEISGMSASDRDFWKACFRIQNFLESEMEAKGQPCAIRYVDGALMILTDAMQYKHGMKTMCMGMRKMIKGDRQIRTTNHTKLNDHDREQWQKNLNVSGRLLAAIRTESKTIIADTAVRLPKRNIIPPTKD